MAYSHKREDICGYSDVQRYNEGMSKRQDVVGFEPLDLDEWELLRLHLECDGRPLSELLLVHDLAQVCLYASHLKYNTFLKEWAEEYGSGSIEEEPPDVTTPGEFMRMKMLCTPERVVIAFRDGALPDLSDDVIARMPEDVVQALSGVLGGSVRFQEVTSGEFSVSPEWRNVPSVMLRSEQESEAPAVASLIGQVAGEADEEKKTMNSDASVVSFTGQQDVGLVEQKYREELARMQAMYEAELQAASQRYQSALAVEQAMGASWKKRTMILGVVSGASLIALMGVLVFGGKKKRRRGRR